MNDFFGNLWSRNVDGVRSLRPSVLRPRLTSLYEPLNPGQEDPFKSEMVANPYFPDEAIGDHNSETLDRENPLSMQLEAVTSSSRSPDLAASDHFPIMASPAHIASRRSDTRENLSMLDRAQKKIINPITASETNDDVLTEENQTEVPSTIGSPKDLPGHAKDIDQATPHNIHQSLKPQSQDVTLSGEFSERTSTENIAPARSRVAWMVPQASITDDRIATVAEPENGRFIRPPYRGEDLLPHIAGQPVETSSTRQTEPAIQVTIGRIEVKATQTTPPPVKDRKDPEVMSLAEYLHRRDGGL